MAPGSLATIGRKRAVAQLGPVKLTGFVAWLLWSLVHVYFLIGYRNRLAVAMNWGWNYITFQRGTRLITGISGSRIEDVVPVVMTAPPMAAGLELLDIGRASRTPASAQLSARNALGHG